VAEDYAPFNVDVTTEEPAVYPDNTVGWVMITETTDKNGTNCPHHGYGGIAYLNVFGNSNYDYYSPAWVKEYSSTYTAEASSHELGHNMGLSHDGTSSSVYYHGHDNGVIFWDAIMGGGVTPDVSQWSRGEYYDANLFQDDLLMINWKLGYRTDDHGDDPASASLLNVVGIHVDDSGYIETTGDPDVFEFTSATGTVTLNATPYKAVSGDWGSNLDIILELRNESGALIASNNPIDDVTASITTDVPNGRYYLYVKPTGVGTPMNSTPTGYTIYGSLGSYALSGTVHPVPFMIYQSHTAVEVGDGNGLIEAGESADLRLWLKNIGLVTASDVIVELTNVSSYLFVTSSSRSYGNVAPGVVVSNEILFNVTIASNCPAGSHELKVHIDADNGHWTHTFLMTVEISGPAESFEWNPISSPQEVNAPFAVTIRAKDAAGHVAKTFTNTAFLCGQIGSDSASTLVITECDSGAPDAIEIQNVSGYTIDASGWVVVLGDSYSNIDDVHSIDWNLSSMSSGEVLYKTDSSSDQYWGGNISWAQGDNGWAMIVDDEGNVVDFLAWGWDASSIAGMAPIVNGYTISIESEFVGNGVSSSGTGSIQRQGNEDTHSATNFSWATPSVGTQNSGLSIPFANETSTVAITPANSGDFVNGVWSGSVRVLEIVSNMFLYAENGAIAGSSDLFDVGLTSSIPYLVYNSHAAVDVGDGNGLIEAGESADLRIWVKNVGLADATNVIVTLTNESSYLSVTSPPRSYGDVAPGAVISNGIWFNVAIAPNCPAGSHELKVHIDADNGNWTRTFLMTVEISGPAESFEWNPISSPQEINAPFAVRVRAKDAAGYVAKTFSDPVELEGYRQSSATNLTVGTGSSSWNYPLSTYYHDARTQVIYTTNEFPNSCTITSLALNVTTSPGQALNQWTIRMKHTDLNSYSGSPEWDGSEWTLVYQNDEPIPSTGWVTFPFSTPFDYNGAKNLMIDFSFNGTNYTSDGKCRYTVAGTNQTIYYRTDSEFGDPLMWDGSSPSPNLSAYVPNIKLGVHLSEPVSITPTNSAVFVDGVWTGTVTVLDVAFNMNLRANDSSGHKGDSFPFDVYLLDRIDLTNDALTVSYDTDSFAVSGTNTSGIMGLMWVSNAANQVISNFPATPVWVAPALPLEFGDNPFYVYGSNYNNDVATDHVTIMREGPAVLTNYVSLSGSHISPFETWETAATNIQDAVEVLWAGGTTHVTNGTYVNGQTITPGYDSLNRVVITNNITVQSVNGPEVTIVQGQGPMGSNAIRCVYMSDGTLSGFTLTQGYTQNLGFYLDRSGGGVNARNGGTITNCTILNNRASFTGGGAYYGIFNHCTISGNRAGTGGGGTVYTTNNHCTISGNISEFVGGGAYYGTLNNCTISGNSADYGGGTVYTMNNNCTISGNRSGVAGGGAHSATLNHCTITGNRSKISGGGTYESTLNNCIVYYNRAPDGANYYGGTYDHSCTAPDPGGTGNITNAPQLVSASHIVSNSPCISAGNPLYASGTDIDGEAWTNPPSMGCDEVYTNHITGALDVSIVAEYTNAVINHRLHFTADIHGKLSRNVWSYGDGTQMTNAVYASHSWADAGDYPVILTAFNTTYPAGLSVTVMVHIVSGYTNYVSPSGSHQPPFTSWTTAATHIQAAVDASESFDIAGALVLVSNGVYNVGETITPGYRASNRVVITKEITVQSVNGPEGTIIEGQGPMGSNAVRCVYMSDGILAGFTLTHGCTQSSGDYHHDRSGGGVNAINGGAITNCMILSNRATFMGGGAYYGTLNQCAIRGNVSINNGGGTAYGMLNHCTLSGNTADFGGGTYYGTLNHCTISGNTADFGGGAVYGILNNCTISGNSAVETGGGTYAAIFNNCIVYDNHAFKNPNHYNSTYYYSCTTPAGGSGNITNAPQFVDTNAANYRLTYHSPCIDAGNNAYVVDDFDLDGNPRIYNGTVDMGAYEATYGLGMPFVDVTTIPQNISYEVSSFSVSGTNNNDVVGTMWVSNTANNAVLYFPATPVWVAPALPLEFGDNPFYVYGSNDHNDVATDHVTIMREGPAVLTNYVSLSGSHTSPFETWETAATNIQDAVEVLWAGGTTHVTNGTYANGQTITPGYDSLNRVVITNPITVQSVNGPEVTIVQGQGPLGDHAVRCVYLSDGTLSGFTLTQGYTQNSGDYLYDQSGGGVNARNGGAITNCMILNNRASLVGGGASYGTFNHCTISENRSGFAGGGTVRTLNNHCTISGNRSEIAGGGTLHTTNNNCTISGNRSGVAGGGAYYGIFNHCTITGNRSGTFGGGTYGSTLNNCIVYYNHAPDGADHYGGTYDHSCTIPDPGGSGNITNAPQLVSASHIGAYSPCISAGNPLYASGTDIDGEAWTNPPSMGCDEVYTNHITGALDVSIVAEYTNAVINHRLHFTADIHGKLSRNVWSYGDGTQITNAVYSSHSWADAGDYPVILTAFNTTYPAGISTTVMVHIVSGYTNYVSPSGSHQPPFTSWATAATNIQAAVEASESFDIAGAFVRVSNGVYSVGETITPGYSASNRVVITKEITVQSVNGPEGTIIEGQGPIGSNAVRCVYMSDGILSGFTLTHGCTPSSGDDYQDRSGGGVNAIRGGAIENCMILSNRATFMGGGASYGTLNTCSIRGNVSINNGGGTAYGILNHCTISGNTSYLGGGTYYGMLNHCNISGNTADFGGGAVYGILNNCTVSGNSALETGGGAYAATFNNCVVYYNHAFNNPNHYGSIYDYSCTTPAGGSGNITNAPQFVDTNAANYRLTYHSPCIDAGNNAYVVDDFDLDGNPRIYHGIVDMGCYEFSKVGWWYDYGVIDFAVDSMDYAAANLGQLKHVASKAREAMDDLLPGGAGTNVHTLVDGFQSSNNYVVINLGQLKYVAQPFYDVLTPDHTHLWPLGMTVGPYPWSGSTNAAQDYAVGNIGQLKYIFSFDFSDGD